MPADCATRINESSGRGGHGYSERHQDPAHAAEPTGRRRPVAQLRRRLHLHPRRRRTPAPIPHPGGGRRHLLHERPGPGHRQPRGPRADGRRGPAHPRGHDRRGLDQRGGAAAEPGPIRPGLRHLGAAGPRGRPRRTAEGRPHRLPPVHLRRLRRAVPRMGARSAPRRRLLVHRRHGRPARLPGGQVPSARGLDAPRPAAPGAPAH